jgi:carbonic anhydrase
MSVRTHSSITTYPVAEAGSPNADDCACCAGLIAQRFSRRHFLQMGGGMALATALPFPAFSAEGNYEAMVLTCIDPRFQDPIRIYLDGRGLLGKYSQFTFAGAAIGVVAWPFRTWRKAFWDNLSTSIQLHHIQRVIAIDHRDCGAARIAYGAAKVANKDIETATHAAALTTFRQQVARRHRALTIETGLMALDGSIEMVG